MGFESNNNVISQTEVEPFFKGGGSILFLKAPTPNTHPILFCSYLIHPQPHQLEKHQRGVLGRA